MKQANNDTKLLFHYSHVKSWKAVHFKSFHLQHWGPSVSLWFHLPPCHWQQSCSSSWWKVPLHNPAVEITSQWLPSTRSHKVTKIPSKQPGPRAMTARKWHQIALLPVTGYQYRTQKLWDTLGIPHTWGHHGKADQGRHRKQGRHGN